MSSKKTQDSDSYGEFDEKANTDHTNKSVLVIQNLMRTQDSRDWVWNHLVSCGVFESTFDIDPIRSGYNAGRRDSGLRLEREIKEMAPGDYLKMIKESIDG